MKLLKIVSLLFVSVNCVLSYGQILHSESFAVILDSNRVVKGNIIPDFKFQNLKEDLIAFDNTTDISFRIKKSALTIANKIELSKYGKDVLLSGGFLYLEYRKIFENKFVIEPYSQIHWSEVRGLQFKYAGGVNLKYRIYMSNKVGFYVGTGPFYEYENWNYNGVKDNLLPPTPENVISKNVKLGSYLSFKWKSDYNFDVDISVYHQSAFTEITTTPRLASSSSIKYNFTEHLGLVLQYQNIYDYKPLVPIDKLYNQFTGSFEVSF